MKKFSTLVLSFLVLIVAVLSGCTHADNATLLSIQEKYNYISLNNENVFVGDVFNPNYQSEKLTLAISDDDLTDFNNLLSSDDRMSFDSLGVYGILYRGINSTYLTNDVLSVTNNAQTRKEYKKNMYIQLENLQSHIGSLNSTKRSLENVFNNSSKSYMIIAKEDIAKYNLTNYYNSLNKCLKDLLEYNKVYGDAVNNDIVKIVTIDDLLYGGNVTIDYSANNQLINDCSLLISDYILNYSINVKNNALENKELISNLKEILSLQISLKSDDVTESEKLEGYKISRVLEDGVKKQSEIFDDLLEKNKKEVFSSIKEEDKYKQEFIESYKNKLLDYSNKLISYLKSL